MRSNHFILLISLILFTAILHAHPFGDAVSVNTLSTEQTRISFNLPQFELKEFPLNDFNFTVIEMEGAFTGADTSLPDLPHFSAVFAVPIGSSVSIAEVTHSQPHYIQTLPILPVQNIDNPDYTFDYDYGFYLSKDQNTIYPQTAYYITEVQTLRDYQFVTVKINPLRYKPLESIVEIVDSYTFIINHTADTPKPSYTLRPVISRAFERIYENIFMNYDQVRSPDPVYQVDSILLIYGGSNHSSNFMTALNNIVNLRKQQGYEVEAVTTATAGSSTGTIKTYIQNKYNTAPNPPEWIVLVGDTSGSYPIPCYPSGSPSGSSDYPYTHLAGGDMIGDVFIGRISVSSENHITNYWLKLQKYELNSPTTDYALFKKSLLVGHSSSSGISTYIINRYIKSLIQAYDPTITNSNINEIYYNSGQGQTVNDSYDAGNNNFNFRGYVGMDIFGGHTSATTNTNILTNSVMLTCATGNFGDGYGDAQTENLMRGVYGSQPSGAILATGMSTSSTHTQFNNAASGGIYYAMYAMDVPTMGEAVLFGKIFLNGVYPNFQWTENTTHWVNTMGDPSLRIFKTTPKTFSTTVPTQIGAGTQAFRFVVTDEAGAVVPDAWVTIAKADGTYISKAISDTLGIAYLPHDHTQTLPLLITISKPGFHQKRVLALTPGDSNISVTQYTVNGSQNVNPGDNVNLTISVKNFLTNDAQNLTATISSESDYVTFSGNTTINIGSVNAGQEIQLNNAFTFTVSPITPDKVLLPLTVTITDGETTWTSYLLPSVKGVDLKVTNLNQIHLNIGGASQVSFNLKNEGNIATGALQANLISRSIYMTTTGQVAAFPNIAVGASANQSTPFTVNVVDFMISGMKLKADLHVYNDTGFDVLIPVELYLGNKVVGDPTGPDNYGYVIYHSSDTNTDERPTYDWTDIKSIGTNTGMNDSSGTQEEDKRTATLPFTASFYGVEYSQITICSNGWFVFGTTEQKDFRNVPLPGPVAPRALVAPYWADLVNGSSYGGGGVYTYHDTIEHAFIIQWDKMRLVTGNTSSGGHNYFQVSSDSVTFQAIIYDPVYNGTALGDSKIKIQYRKFHIGKPAIAEFPELYFTMGIQNQDASDGIQYVFNNVYEPGSNLLSNESALLITQPNFLIEQPHLQVSRVYYHPESGGTEIKAGEHTNIGVSLLNVGVVTATNVTATLSINSHFVDVTEDTASFPDIETAMTSSNLSYFTIYIDPDIANNTNLTATLQITANGSDEEPLVWTRNFSFFVVKPSIAYRSFLINDSQPGGNSDGIVDPAETIKLILNIANPTNYDIKNTTAQITTESPLVTINSGVYTIPTMKANTTYQVVFDITMSSAVEDVDNITFNFTTQSQNASATQRVVSLGINQSISLFQEFFDAWPGGWTFSGFQTSWSRSMTDNAGGTTPEAKLTGSNGNSGTTRLISPAINTTDINRVLITFRHTLLVSETQTGGAILALATRRSNTEAWGTVWTQPVTSSSIEPTLQSVDVNNATLGSTTFQFCLYYQGHLGDMVYWCIDNIAVQNTIGNTATLSGTVTSSDDYGDVTGLKISAGDFNTDVRPNGTYTLYLLPRLYPTLNVIDPYFVGTPYNAIDLSPGDIVSGYDFTLNYKAPASAIWIHSIESNPDSRNSNVTLKWVHEYNHETDPLNFTNFKVYRQVNSTEYTLLTTTTNTQYTASVNPAEIYRYYVIASYASGDSEISPIKYIDPATMVEEDGPGADTDTAITPITFTLKQNYPNPFNPSTNIAFSIPADSRVNVSVFNIKGQLVKTLKNEYMLRGDHIIQWNGDNATGHTVGSGIYFIRVSDGHQTAVKKALLLK